MTRHFKQIIAFSLCIIFVVSLFGCSKSSNANSNADKVKLGVIETTGYKKSSYIHFYDENMNYLYTEHNKYASLSEYWDYPTVSRKTMYAIPMGKFEVREERCILEYSITDNTYKEYETGLQAMNSMALSKNYVFGVNTINADSTITQNTLGNYDTVTAKRVFDNLFIPYIEVIDEQLFAIVENLESSSNYSIQLYILSVDDLSTIKVYDLTSYQDPTRIAKYKDKLYITNQYTNAIDGYGSDALTVINLNTDEISQIHLPVTYLDDVAFIGDELVVSECQLVESDGNAIAFVDTSTGDSKSFDLKYTFKSMCVDGNYVYTLGDDKICQYKYENDSLELIKVSDIPVHSNSRTYYYVSAFFVCD